MLHLEKLIIYKCPAFRILKSGNPNLDTCCYNINLSIKTYLLILQYITLETHDLVVSREVFSSGDLLYVIHNPLFCNAHVILDTRCCAMLPSPYNNLQTARTYSMVHIFFK